ncbi:MAG: LysR family transcriptional regulator [Lachnospiraceae bacterium]|nr:LysR family transcriptional regulator [Lachnospiraceae bacterium]
MNINQLKYVITIANTPSIRDAATKLFVSQPALSSSIHDLEDELGILLFERSNKGVKLTDAGREFLIYAKKVVGQYEILEDRYLAGDKEKERFSVSTQHYNFAITSFANVLKRFSPANSEFMIHETKTMDVLEHVKEMRSEVGVVSYSGSNYTLIKKLLKEYQLEFVPLMRRETYAYVWKESKLAKEKVISLEDLKDYPCVSFDQGDNDHFYLNEEAMGDYDFQKMIRSDDRATTMELIAQLGGYSIGSGMLAEENAILRGLVSIKLKEEDPLIIGYITRKGGTLSKYGLAYIDELTTYKELK